jgi:hypothetical protein
MGLAALLPWPVARAGAVVLGGGGVALSHLAVQRRVVDLERENATSLEDDVCEVLIHNIDLLEHLMKMEGGLFRASVLLVDGPSQTLKLTMASHGYTERDREVSWEKGQGPPGVAWQLGRPVVGHPPVRSVPRPRGCQNFVLPGGRGAGSGSGNGSRPMSAEQVRYFDGVKMMICYPITDLQHPNLIIGVVTLDDRLPPGTHLDEVLRAVEFLRDEVRRRLFAPDLRRRVPL